MTFSRVIRGDTLSRDEARHTALQMMEGKLSPEVTAGLLSIMAYRGETVAEITGFAEAMIEKSQKVTAEFDVIDTCGTGGDGSGTYNVSTASALLVSSLGVKVAKHGNRSVSSKSGSADVLEILGVPVEGNPEECLQRLSENGLSFFFAPHYHSAMKHVAPVRQALGQRTIFNVLGPLTNPAGARVRVIGAYSLEAAKKMAEAAMQLPIDRALFVHARDGLDEFSAAAPTDVIELRNGKLTEYVYTPEDAGLRTRPLEGALVRDARESGALIEALLQNEGPEDAKVLLLLNAGAALYAAGQTVTIKEGVQQAETALHHAAFEQLEQLRRKGAGTV
ncbi:anthranilate phosphoribosyltransferase [Bacillus daqingensis]|uniref:Anthranilate phosphoribosyltransferase n=1 Tax=Bacillus daqingensis TaxID=872396 RepID=A0ABV9NTX7_9BACI